MKKRKVRKPRPIKTKHMYAGISPQKHEIKNLLYIGGPYYFDYAQIHFSERNINDLKKLNTFLTKAIAYLEEQK